MLSIWKHALQSCENAILGPSLNLGCEGILALGQTTKRDKRWQLLLYTPELMEMICRYLTIQEFAVLVKVSKRLYQFVTPKLYKHVCFHGASSLWALCSLLQSVNPTFKQSGLLNRLYELGQDFENAKQLDVHLNRFFNRIIGIEPKPRSQCCSKFCLVNRQVANNYQSRKFVVPTALGSDTHRFKGAVYGIIPKHTNKVFNKQYVYNAPPCLQLPSRKTNEWTVEKAKRLKTNGPFVQSLAITNMNVLKDVLIGLFSKMENLNSIQLSECPTMDNDCIREIAERCNERLLRVTLIDLPLLTNLGLYYLAKNCPNIEYVDLTNCLNISEGGIRTLLIMCPFIHTLILNRFGFGTGYSINEKIVPFIPPYGVSLKRLGLAGCALGEKEILTLIEKCTLITAWMFNTNQLGTRKFKFLKKKIARWFKSKIVLGS